MCTGCVGGVPRREGGLPTHQGTMGGIYTRVYPPYHTTLGIPNMYTAVLVTPLHCRVSPAGRALGSREVKEAGRSLIIS